MRSRWFWPMWAVAAITGLAIAQERPGPPAAGRVIGLVRVGALDETLVERVRAFVEDRLSIPTRVLGAREARGGTLNEEGDAVADLTGPDVLLVVALVDSGSREGPHGILIPEKRIGVVNAAALKPSPDDPERYGRRLEKQSMRAIGFLLDLTICPNPQCALANYSTLEELDEISRDFCPPCTVRAQEKAVAQGAILIEREYPPIGEAE